MAGGLAAARKEVGPITRIGLASRVVVAALACALCVSVQPASARVITEAVAKGTNGWYWPTGTESLSSMGGWMQDRGGQWHLAKDISAPYGSPVYALTDGVVYSAYAVLDGYAPAGAIVVMYRNESGGYFKALYGHVKSLQYKKGDTVKAGAIIGYIGQSNPYHLHFGIHPGTGLPTDPQHNVFRGHTYVKTQTYGWSDPVAYLRTHSPWVPPKPVVLSAPVLPASIPAGRLVSVAATMSPTHAYDTGLMRLDRWRLSGVIWQPAGIEVLGQLRNEPVARGRIQFPAGTWRVRTVFAGDLDHLPGASPWVTVTVR